MVAAVAAKGYAAATVADLTEISGVSSRTFYDLFADKRACFLAALEAMIEAATVYAAQSQSGIAEGGQEGAGWEEQARQSFDSFAEMVALQPAASRMALIESYAAGAEAMVPLENAVAGFEWLTRQTLAQSPERAEMPGEMVSAHIGAMREIASTRLREGREAELPGLMDELWRLISSYRPPPQPLRPTGRARRAQPESLEAHDHAERALRAFAVVVAEKGYEATTVEAVLRRAAMSATTFYANFRGKEDVLMAAIDSAGAQIVAATCPPSAGRRTGRRGAGGVWGVLNFLASRPALARLVTAEVYAAGPAAVARRAEAVEALGKLIGEGYERSPQTPRIATEMIAGGVYTLTYRRIRDSGPESLPGLAPLCTYIALAPFIGAEEACRVANGDGRARPGA